MSSLDPSQPPNDYFRHLPNELSVLIFSTLGTKDLLNVSQTCKHWNFLAEDDSLWKPLYKERWGSTVKTNKKKLTDEEEIRGWRGWKNKYTSKINWINGRVIHTTSLNTHKRPISALDMDSDHEFATASEDSTIKIWDVATGTEIRTIAAHNGTISALQMDKKIMVSGSSDSTIKIWSREGECLRTLRRHTAKVTCLQFGKGKIISRGWDMNAFIWDLETGQCISARKTSSVCTSLYFNNNLLVCGYYDDKLKTWDLRTGSCHRVFYGHSGLVSSVHFDENTLASAGYDKVVKVWDLRQGLGRNTDCTFHDHKDRVYSVRVSGQKLVSGGQDKNVMVWNLSTKSLLYKLSGVTSPVRRLTFDDKKIIAGTSSGSLHVWNFAEIMAY